MKGKEKCKILKDIRREIAAKNDINLVIEECTHKGECRGTCPRCEAEVRYLERELEKRERLGKRLAVVGVSATLMASAVACSPRDLENVFANVFGSGMDGGVPCGPVETELVGITEAEPLTEEFSECEGTETDCPETEEIIELAGDVAVFTEAENGGTAE